MTATTTTTTNLYDDRDAFLAATATAMGACFDSLPAAALQDGRAQAIKGALKPGKMLRSRLAWALCPQDPAQHAKIVAAAAATELLHNATLFHDDVIDDAAVRRARPALWQQIGANGAILLGDLFFCSALAIVSKSGSNRNLQDFIARMNEVCGAEITHELACKGSTLGLDAAKTIARGKTGALFAFVAEVCGGDDTAARERCRAAGYAVGTAYQLADDLLDEEGAEADTGKTLGTDRSRNKFTLAQSRDISHAELADLICHLCDDAIGTLGSTPAAADRLRAYVAEDLLPARVRQLSTTAQ